MDDVRMPDERDYLADYRVGVDFVVGARDMAEARALVERMLATEDSDGSPFVTQRHRRLDDDRSWGVSGWEAVPPRPSQAALVLTQYPELAAHTAAVDALRALLEGGDRPVTVNAFIPRATRDRIRVLLHDVDPVLRAEDPDDPLRLVFEGAASDAAAHLAEGVYRAFDYEDREYALVVAPSELTRTGLVSSALPRDVHDSRTLDEIAALLRGYEPGSPALELLDRISRRLETTRRPGLPPGTLFVGSSAPASAAEAHVDLGVIVWSDMEGQDPTVLVDSDPVQLTRRVAETLYEVVRDSGMFDADPGFLTRHPAPAWGRPEAVDAWLDALQAEIPYPAFSIQRLDVGPRTSQQPPPSPAAQRSIPAPTDQTASVLAAAARSGRSIEYQIPVVFQVMATSEADARRFTEESLGAAAQQPLRDVERELHGRRVRDIEGLLGWHHPDDPGPGSPHDGPDPHREALRLREQEVDASPPGTAPGDASAEAAHQDRGLRGPA